MARAWASALLCITVLGCDRGPQAVHDLPLYEVWISSPHEADQAMVVSFQDPVEAFQPAPDIQPFQATSFGPGTVLLVADWPLPAGETLVGTARLRTVERGRLPTGQVVEVARSDYQLRESVAGYRVRLVPR